MKKLILLLAMTTGSIIAQDFKQVPQISVTGEGKIKVIPDEAMITVSIESTSKDATEAKKENDIIADKILKLIKQKDIESKDFQSQRISLNKKYDYSTKKNNYVANQTISIHLKDLSKYEDLMMALVETGINGIQGVEFISSKIKDLEKQARKQALLNALSKADDYVSVLKGQKVGKALLINDNSQTYYPQTQYKAVRAIAMESDMSQKETIAIGEIEIIATVSAIFALE